MFLLESPGPEPSISQVYGEAYGPDSMCIESTLVANGYPAGYAWGAGCYNYVCSIDSRTVTIQVNAASGLVPVVCSSSMAGQVQRVAGFLSSTGIACPDPAIVCAAPQQYIPVLMVPSPLPPSASPSPSYAASSTGTRT